MKLKIKKLFSYINLAVIFLALSFIFLHFQGISRPYHQDEYKWVIYSHPELTPPGTVPHPPLTEFIYTRFGPFFGDDGFRFIPFIFGFLNLFLIFYLLKNLFDEKVAIIGSFLFVFSFYSLLSTLMVDVDGAIMPFFFLVLLIGYFRWKDLDFIFNKESYKWIFLCLVGIIGGFLIKISFVLSIAAVFLDYLILKEVFKDKRKIFKYVGFGFVLSISLVALLFLSKFIFPYFNLEYSLKYWEHFISLDRGWLQTFIQCAKSLLYLSPLLFFMPLFGDREIFKKTRVFWLFLIFAFIFYIILFDFSIGALDRYLQLLIIPTVIISSAILAKIGYKEKRFKEFCLLGAFVSLVLLLILSLPHNVYSLYPKVGWIGKIISLRWNFLYPFFGGSGPLGFYISFLFIGLSWIIPFVLFVFGKTKPQYKNLIIAVILPIGIIYNLVFISEYLFGFKNGSSERLVKEAVEFMKNDQNIKMVTVYNDNGGWDIQEIGKYRKRLYIDPMFDIREKVSTMNKYKEHYFVLDIPRIDPASVYQRYFDSCRIIYSKVDKKISATIYDCTKVPDLKI